MSSLLRNHLLTFRPEPTLVTVALAIQVSWYYLGRSPDIGRPAEVRVMAPNINWGQADAASFVAVAERNDHSSTSSRLTLGTPEPIRHPCDLTRNPHHHHPGTDSPIQWLEKLLEDAGIKLSSIAADLNCASSRAMLQALVTGQTDPAAISDLAKKRMRVKIPQLPEALYGRFTEHDAFLTRTRLNIIDQRTVAIEEFTDCIEVVMEPFRGQVRAVAYVRKVRTASEVVGGAVGA